MNDNKHGYKAYDPGLTCRGYQYEENKVFEKNGHGVCVPGVTHFCVNPFDVLDYYPLVREDGKFSDFTTVEAIEEPVTNDGQKFATSKIKIGFKLGFAGFIKACIDFVYEKTIKDMPKSDIGKGSSGDSAKIGSSGDSAKIGSSGYSAQIGSSGDSAQIGSSGYSAQIGSSGDYAKIGSSGYYAKIGSSGYYAKIDISGSDSVGAAVGVGSTIRGAVGNWITLAEWAYDSNKCRCVPVCVKSAQIDGEIIKADVWYKLSDGEFVEVENDEQ